MSTLSPTLDPREDAAALAAAASARAVGLSWRQIERQMREAGLRISHVALRSRLTRPSPPPPVDNRITRAVLIESLLPLVAERRASGKTMREVAAELTAAGFPISHASLKVYLGRSRAAACARNSSKAPAPTHEEPTHA
jgi:hypothetical protein